MTIVNWIWAQNWGTCPEGIDRTLLEVDDEGHIHREIGIDEQGRVLYIAPAKSGMYPYGLFDLLSLVAPSEDEFPRAEFEALWQDGAARFGVREGWTVS